MTALAPLTATIIWRHDWPALVELLEYYIFFLFINIFYKYFRYDRLYYSLVELVLWRVICASLQELV
jgi:hypothetical protein